MTGVASGSTVPPSGDEVVLVVNGREVVAPASRSLAAVLREDLDLVAAKVACGRGECGACTVLVDGRPTMSCVTAAPRPGPGRDARVPG